MKFNTIKEAINEYIKYVSRADQKINKYVSNDHVIKRFKDVLKYSELESSNKELFNNVKHDPYDSIGTNNPDNYDKLEDGRYLKKETYSVAINSILVPEYFNIERLRHDGIDEVEKVYQKLRAKKDIVRNRMMLGRIVLGDKLKSIS